MKLHHHHIPYMEYLAKKNTTYLLCDECTKYGEIVRMKEKLNEIKAKTIKSKQQKLYTQQ